MKNLFCCILFTFSLLFISCDGDTQQRETEETDLIIQGEETGGMGTGPGPGVDVPLDTTQNYEPDTVIVD
ncbi:hypothetical protein BH23BAC1_BH23BAC1_37420 [soil metagenome]